MKTSFFRWAIGLLSILGAALVTTAVTGPDRADAAGGRQVTVSLWARTDVAPSIVVRVLDPASNDIAATCQRGAGVSPDIDEWRCQSAEDLVFDMSAAPGVAIELSCFDSQGTPYESTTGQIAFPATLGNINCLARATPPASAPPITPVSLSLTKPAGQPGLALTLLDEQGNDRIDECTSNGSSTTCSPLPYGVYHFGVRGGTAATHIQVSCFIYTTTAAHATGMLAGIDSIELGPWTLTATCSAVGASPVVEVHGTAQLVQLVDDAGTATDCTPVDTLDWSCNVPATGGYHLELAEQSASLPVECPSAYGNGAVDPEAFTITGEGIEWYSCAVLEGAPPTPTTIGGPVDSGAPSDTTDSEGPLPTTTVAPRGLPSTGGSAPLLPAALVLLALGAGASLLARRPVR